MGHARHLPAALLLLVAAAFAAAGDPPPPSLAGADPKARIALAQELEKKDVPGLVRAIDALALSKSKDADRDFLVQYVMQERDRGLRMSALAALARLDRKAASDWFKARADGKEELPTVVALEALARLGTKDDASVPIDLIKSANEMVAVAAADCAARLGTSKECEAIAENGLAHPSEHVTNHAAWAVQDILKKPKLAIALFEKYASKKTDPRSIRAGATVALLQDKTADPHEWGDTLAPVKDVLLKAPAAVDIRSDNPEFKKNVQAGLDWLKTNMPAAELLVRASAKRIDVPGVKRPDDWVDLDIDVIQVPVDRATWKPNQLALHLLWMGTVLFEKRCGEPSKAHRGWEPAIFDVYDLCVIARLYDAGPGGLSRSNFMKDQVAKHPWGSQ